MSCDYWISVRGFHAAERDLLAAAREIARPPSQKSLAMPGSAIQDPVDSFSISGEIDYAAALVALAKAKTDAKANLRALSIQQDLESATLDVIG